MGELEPLIRLQRAKRPGVLFCGGAARCVFQVGVIETLYDFGIEPAVLLGVSGGAWNAAAVAAGNGQRLRAYWKFFTRMPHLDLRNLMREHSPYIWRRLHQRAFRRYVPVEQLKSEEALPVFIALTRLRDRASVVLDLKAAADPFEVLLASNYLPPFYTHAPVIDGERYGDAGFSDNLPYDILFEQGCDEVVVISQKGECEGGLFRNMDEPDHVVPERFRHRMTVIRPRHRLDLRFNERRWEKLSPIADYGARRAREVLLATQPAEPDECRHGKSPSTYLAGMKRLVRRIARGASRQRAGTREA